MEVPINKDSTTTHLIMKVVINLQSTIKKKTFSDYLLRCSGRFTDEKCPQKQTVTLAELDSL